LFDEKNGLIKQISTGGVLQSMRRYAVVFALAVFFTVAVVAQEVTEIGREELLSLTHRTDDTTYVINFWATWCSPCVKEIGYFEDLHSEQASSGVRVILVSLDFPNQIESRVIPFLQEKNITAPVMLMTDLRYNEWIDRVDPGWSGAIPATLIYKNEHRVFLEKELTHEELLEQVILIRN